MKDFKNNNPFQFPNLLSCATAAASIYTHNSYSECSIFLWFSTYFSWYAEKCHFHIWQEKRSFLWSIRTFVNLILTFAQKLLKMSFSTSQVISTFLKEGIVKNYFFSPQICWNPQNSRVKDIPKYIHRFIRSPVSNFKINSQLVLTKASKILQ